MPDQLEWTPAQREGTCACSVFENPWTVARQVPLSMEFPRQECWSGLPFPFPGDLPDPGIKPSSPVLAGRFVTTQPPGKPEEKRYLM